MNGIKNRLKKDKDKWVEELLSVLWVYRITSLKVTNETSYSLACDFEDVSPLKVDLTTIQTGAYNDNHNAEVLVCDLDLAGKMHS